MKVTTLIFLLLAVTFTANAQKERKFVREGNDLFNKQDFEKSEVEYRKALDKKAESFEAAFNLGDALYKQQKYDEALQQFSTLAKEETNRERLGELYHNIGNTLLAMQKTDESIEAYKESLRNRPTSQETKYNLEFARNKKQKDQENKDQQNKDNKDNKDQQDQNKDQNKDSKDQKDQDKDKQDQNKDQNKDQQDKNKDQNKDNKDQNKDQNKDNKDQKDQNKDQQDQQPKDQPGKISRQDAQRLLEALQNDEKKVQEKVQKEKVQQQKAKKMKIEKDW